MSKKLLLVALIALALFISSEARSEPVAFDNIRLPQSNSLTLTLDSHSSKCLEKEYRIEGGQVEIFFYYSITSNTVVKDSTTVITLNGQPIYKILPCDNGKQVKLSGNLNAGTYTFGFCVKSPPTEVLHQILISNLNINQKKKCTPGWSSNLIVNGNFEQNSCDPKHLWCTYNQKNYNNEIPGWMPSPEIEVVQSTYLNKAAWAKVGQSWVIELDATGNTCIKQRVGQMKKGKYVLRLNWAPMLGYRLYTSEFDVKVAGKISRSFRARNHDIQKQVIQFTLSEDPADPWLEFCGTGKSDNVGAGIDNLELVRFNEC